MTHARSSADNAIATGPAVDAMIAARHRQLKANDALGKWLSASLDDKNVCTEMKMDVLEWFEAHQSVAADLLPVQPQGVSAAVDTTDYTELRASLADNITLFSHHKAALLRLVDAKIASTLSRPQRGPQ